MIRRPDKMSRAAPTAASSIVFIISAEKVCDGAKSSLMAASFHIADRGSPVAFGDPFFSASGRFLELGDLAGSKEVGPERFGEFGGVATKPYSRRGKGLDSCM